MAGPAGLPAGARAVHGAVTDAVRSARQRDAEAFTVALERLSRLDAERVRLLMGHLVRGLVERAHPDGIGSDDLGTLVGEVLGRTAAWWPDLHPDALVAVLMGAFGVHPDPADDERGWDGWDAQDYPPPPPSAPQIASSAALLAAELLDRTGSAGSAGPAGSDLAPHLDAAFAELARAETVELP